MPAFSLALSEVMSNMWDPYMPNIRCAFQPVCEVADQGPRPCGRDGIKLFRHVVDSLVGLLKLQPLELSLYADTKIKPTVF